MTAATGARPPSSTAPAAPRRLPYEVWVLVAAGFVIAIGFGVVAPALPTFAKSFDVGVTAASIIVSVFAAMRLVFAPVSGRLVAFFGERPIYLVGILIVAVATGVCAFAQSYWQLLLFRSLAGTGSTMFTVSAVALLIRVTPPELRGRASGLWSTGFLLGNIAGPLVGGGLVEVSLRAPFLVYGGTLFVAAGLAWLLLRRSRLAAPERGDGQASVTFWSALRHPTYRAALASNFAFGWTVFGVRVSLVPLFVTAVLHHSEGLAGISLSVFAVGNAALLIVSGRLADARGRKPMVLAGLAVSAVGTIAIGFTHEMWTFLAASLVAGLGAGLLSPPQSAALADIVGARGRGGPVLAGFQMAADVGAILGPLVAGLLADSLSYPVAFALTGAMFLFAMLAWIPAPETLPRGGPTEHAAEEATPECGRLDEGPDVPTVEPGGAKPPFTGR
ncbi:putative arabinose efflux permease, MFS family [Streptoalloteichus tenebrarius]|uniref:Arabinose efflux permease, MFS family n=1 Tax=Streptoalloteichus tenebrarius (strain ATCC 17920 / DSM 40477 / JCM 4838 / CBS 697.72 / NBRC 16177 / NCIMB 11028 / NRRL B-12390 / A12253. 1 / ISP 5477) TaxID=1933 RepID=A0ABT1I0U1_STRSD|nr:MFS transporter [Streptoalloteichus tenebrarius]MCP2261379.1 putative arabinose efflux permease, MFS family [Streptoalloteichus tenebrarius]BFF00921.1 MFS transporter [Streptoalloteichus tenebrarius]